MREQHIETARGRFGVRVEGESSSGAPLVVCLHGFPDDASTYDELAGALGAQGAWVVAPYLRGYRPSPTDGEMTIEALVDDLFALIDALAPDAPILVVGHDYGAQITYAAITREPGRFRAAVTLAGAHPTITMRNARKHPRQWWMSRYIGFFQMRGVAERLVARNDFAYIDKLWHRWAPGFTPPPDHLRRVKETIAASMPAPIAMYRAGGFDIGTDPIAVPTQYICGARDGCLLPALAEGQEQLFTNDYRQTTWSDAGHFPHLEQPARAAAVISDWFALR